MKLKLNDKWANNLLLMPETGMGYQVVDVEFSDGKTLKGLIVHNSEFLEVPDELKDIDLDEIIRMTLHKG